MVLCSTLVDMLYVELGVLWWCVELGWDIWLCIGLDWDMVVWGAESEIWL